MQGKYAQCLDWNSIQYMVQRRLDEAHSNVNLSQRFSVRDARTSCGDPSIGVAFLSPDYSTLTTIRPSRDSKLLLLWPPEMLTSHWCPTPARPPQRPPRSIGYLADRRGSSGAHARPTSRFGRCRRYDDVSSCQTSDNALGEVEETTYGAQMPV